MPFWISHPKPFIKQVGLFILTGFFLLSFPLLGQAQEKPQLNSSNTRSLKIWDESVSYQLLSIEDPRLSYDGEAYTKTVNGKTVNYVVLNKVFFAKEARGIFRRLKKKKNTLMEEASFPHQGLLDLEQTLLSLEESNGSIPRVRQKVKTSLKKIKGSLELLAWRGLYRESINTSASLKEAKQKFIQEFIRSRMRTIEYHEVAHLLDISQSINTRSFEFKRYSEINAFYTELAYGENPHDVLAQALAGLIDELKQRKTVDFSLEKVAGVLHLLKSQKGLEKAPGPDTPGESYLKSLGKLEKHALQTAGRNLYQENLKTHPAKFALVR